MFSVSALTCKFTYCELAHCWRETSTVMAKQNAVFLGFCLSCKNPFVVASVKLLVKEVSCLFLLLSITIIFCHYLCIRFLFVGRIEVQNSVKTGKNWAAFVMKELASFLFLPWIWPDLLYIVKFFPPTCIINFFFSLIGFVLHLEAEAIFL